MLRVEVSADTSSTAEIAGISGTATIARANHAYDDNKPKTTKVAASKGNDASINANESKVSPTDNYNRLNFLPSNPSLRRIIYSPIPADDTTNDNAQPDATPDHDDPTNDNDHGKAYNDVNALSMDQVRGNKI